MTRIRLYDHPFAPGAPKEYEVQSLGQWLLDHYGRAPTVTIQIFTGEPCADNEITGNVAAILTGDAPEYVILESPGAAFIAAYWVYIVIAILFVAAYLSIPKPQMPGNVNRSQESPNNALGARENKVRLLERVEDIFGTVKSIPSLMMPTYNKYVDNIKVEFGYYCIGRGYYDIADIKDGDTLIADITGASAAVWMPFTSPNSGDAAQMTVGDPITDLVVTAVRAIEVDGITLKAPNQINPATSTSYHFVPDPLGDIIYQNDKTTNFNSVAAPGAAVTITTAPFYETTNGGYDYDGGPVSEINVSGPYDYTGDYTVATVVDGAIRLTTSTFAIDKTLTATVSLINVTEYTDWISLPQLGRTRVIINVSAPSGLFLDNGGKSSITVSFEAQIEQTDLAGDPLPVPVVETVTGSLSGAVTDEIATTIDHETAWTGPARVRMKRTSDHDTTSDGQVQDEIKWVDVYAVSPVDKEHFGNKTTIQTITHATPRATAVKTRELNCIASRKIPTYNGLVWSGAFDADGLWVSGSIEASSKIIDIIAAVSVDPKIGQRDLSTDVDIDQMWEVQQALDAWTLEAGQFNYTFDSDNMSYEETVLTIANAGFCIAYRQNGMIRLALDFAQDSSSALFTHRNKKPASETITRKFANDAEYDGVEFVYSDPDTHQSETISLPLDGSAVRPKKFEIPGIRSYDQAWLRANREYQKLIGQRITIETETTMDARSLLPNARIDIVDNTRFKSYDGEVLGQSGLVLTLSQDVSFADGDTHSLVLMKRDGSLQSMACRPGPAANQVVMTALPVETIVTAYGVDGVRTIYSFAADSVRAAQAYLVQEIDISDGQYAKIRAVNYSDAYYQADFLAIPAKETVIN